MCASYTSHSDASICVTVHSINEGGQEGSYLFGKEARGEVGLSWPVPVPRQAELEEYDRYFKYLLFKDKKISILVFCKNLSPERHKLPKIKQFRKLYSVCFTFLHFFFVL